MEQFSFEKINFAVNRYRDITSKDFGLEYNGLNVKQDAVIDQIFGPGAAKWYESMKMQKLDQRSRVKEFDLAKQIQEELTERFG